MIKNMFNQSITKMKKSGDITSISIITIDLHKRSILNPYHFTLVIMDKLTRSIQDVDHWFQHIYETRCGVNVT